MQHDPVRLPLMPWKYPSHPWSRVHADFAMFRNMNYLVVVDSFSKWFEVVPMKSTTAYRTVEELRNSLFNMDFQKNWYPITGTSSLHPNSKHVIRKITDIITLMPVHRVLSKWNVDYNSSGNKECYTVSVSQFFQMQNCVIREY